MTQFQHQTDSAWQNDAQRVLTGSTVTKFTLPGSYGEKVIEIGVRKSVRPTARIVLFVHGLYGLFDPFDSASKVNDVAVQLASRGLAHTVQYSSSRDYAFSAGEPWADREKAFIFKRFSQELEDLRTVLSSLLANPQFFFDLSSDEKDVAIHGSSLGGTLAILMTEFFPLISKISLCGTGCGGGTRKRPILSSIYSEKDILGSVSRFQGQLLLIQGSEDTVVPRESGVKIIQAARSAKTELRVVAGANHNFTSLYGKEDGRAQKIFKNVLMEYLAGANK